MHNLQLRIRFMTCLGVLAGCSSADTGPDAHRAADAAQPDDAEVSIPADAALQDAGDSSANPSDATVPNILNCEGGDEVVLSYLTQVTAAVVAGSEVLWDNGTQFFLITGSCQYYAQLGKWEPITTGSLGVEEVNGIAERLQLKQLLERPQYCTQTVDALKKRLGLGERYSQQGLCPGEVEDPLNQAFDEAVDVTRELHQAGSGISGAVRFTLLHRSKLVPEEDQDYEDGVEWPLGDPMVFANPAESEDILEVDEHLVEDEGASKLREIRNAAAAKDPYRQFIPIVQGDGARFQLFVRDSLPRYEDDGGVLEP